MLDVTRTRCGAHFSTLPASLCPQEVILRVHEVLPTTTGPEHARNADDVVPTLILEHLPLETFSACAAMLKPDGHVLLAFIHPELAKLTQAGFNCPVSGEKVRPTSHLHLLGDASREAGKCGFEVVDRVMETEVCEEMVQLWAEGR